MAIIIKSTENKKIHVLNTSIEVSEVYGRIGWISPKDGKSLEIGTDTFENYERFLKEEYISVNIPKENIRVKLEEGEEQDKHSAHKYAKLAFESVGYEVEIVL